MRILFLVLAAAAAVFGGETEEQKVDRVFASYVKPGSPGCAVGVLRQGKTVLGKGYGLADLEHGLPLTTQSRFYMASVSKQFTSMSMLLAEAEGKLKLDDSIRKYVPELPEYADDIPIRRMLDHTSGLRDYLSLWGLRGFSTESVLREGSTLALIARQKGLNFPVGTDYNYSNSGYMLAAVALQRATGKTLAEYAQEKIYRPLEMRSSRFQPDHSEPMPDRAHGYHQVDGKWKTADVGFDVIGSGGMYSNIDDMMKWARNFETPVVGGALLRTLQTPGKLVDGRPTPGGYALGIIEKDGTYSHSGGAVGYSTFFLRVPKHAVTVVGLCNVGSAPVARMAAEVAAVYTGEPAPAAAAAAKPVAEKRAWAAGEMARLRGEYWSEELFAVWRLAEADGELRLYYDGPEATIRPDGDSTYKAGDFELEPAPGTEGPVSGFEVNVGRAKGIRFVRR